MADKMMVQSAFVELSEHKNYLELVNLVSYYDYPNGNGTQINYGKTDEEQAATLRRAKTLELMPVKAYYCTNSMGEPTFGGHEASYDKDGILTFGTEKIGVHHEVYIKKANVTAADGTKHRLPCLFAKQRIWTDKANVVAAIKRLYSLGKLNTSWEAQISAYEFKEGVKYLQDYEFIGNAMLGFDDKRHANYPAYGQDAKVVSLAAQEQDNCELMIAEALAKDLLAGCPSGKHQMENEVKTMTDEMNLNEEQALATEVAEVVTEEIEIPEVGDNEAQAGIEISTEDPASMDEKSNEEPQKPEQQVETSALTMSDIIHKLMVAYEKACGHWGHCSFVWPEEHIAWVHHGNMLESEYDQVSYSVESDDVNIASVERVSIALPVRELSQQYSELKRQNEELSDSVVTLTEYKTKYEAIEQAERQKQHDKEVASLKTLVEESGCFTQEEIVALQPMIDGLQKLEIQAKIGERLLAQRKVTIESAQVEQPTIVPRAMLEKGSSANKADEVRHWLHS